MMPSSSAVAKRARTGATARRTVFGDTPRLFRIYDLRSAGRLSRTGDGSRVLVDRAELDRLVGGAS